MGPWEEALAKAKEFKAKQAERERVRNEELFAKFETALVEVVGQDLREDQKRAARGLATFLMNELLSDWIDVWDDAGNGIDSGDLIKKIEAMIVLVKQS
jgi:hypothetical protein